MNKRQLYYWHRKFVFLRAWYFLVLAIAFGLLAVHGLRSNYITMTQLRDKVYVADQQNGDVEGALRNLREYVYSHMNTNMSRGDNAIKPPIQLKYRYERLAAVENDRVKAVNAQVAAQADQVCGAQFPATGYNPDRITCIQQYVNANAVKENGVPDGLYKFDFVSPVWSPDLAGFSILLSGLFSILFVTRTLLERMMQKRLQ